MMAGSDFDKYVGEYRDIINRVSRVSGEQFEFFIQLRLALMKERIAGKAGGKGAMRILDFGCGIGATETYLKSAFPGALIYALDSSLESIRAAQAMKLEDVTFIHSEGFELPFGNDYFDLIYSNGTYHHIDPAHHGRFLREMSRVCRGGGDLFIFENNPRNPLMMRAMHQNPFDADATPVSPGYLQKVAEEAGLTSKEIAYYFFFPGFMRSLRFAEKWLRRIPFGAQYFLWSMKPGL